MQHKLFKSALIVGAMLFAASLALATDSKPGAAEETKATGTAKTGDAKAKKPAAAKVKLVDINSANKAELKTLPGISDADADKIIAGRPYLSKANLVTHNVISAEIYERLKGLVIAKQNPESKPKPAK